MKEFSRELQLAARGGWWRVRKSCSIIWRASDHSATLRLSIVMQLRTFQFVCKNAVVSLEVSCRSPPEDQAGRSLTLQDPDLAGKNAAGAAIPAATTAAAAAASAPDLIGCDLWPASIALCHYFCCWPHLVEGRRVLELGAGELVCGFIEDASDGLNCHPSPCHPSLSSPPPRRHGAAGSAVR